MIQTVRNPFGPKPKATNPLERGFQSQPKRKARVGTKILTIVGAVIMTMELLFGETPQIKERSRTGRKMLPEKRLLKVHTIQTVLIRAQGCPE